MYQSVVTLGEGMSFLKIGQGTVHAANNQLSYRGRLASFYSRGAIDNTLEKNLPALQSYTGFQDNDEPVEPKPEMCLRIARAAKTEMNANTFNCIDLPVEAAGRLVQVWDSNENTSCNFRGALVSIGDNAASLSVNANYAGTRGLAGNRIRIEPSNGCPYLIVRVL